MSRSPHVVVYTRQGCGLCAQAEHLVAREARRATIEHVDVDTDDRLLERYGVRVPVITVDDVEVAELQVEPGAIRKALRAARASEQRASFRSWRRAT